MRRLSAEDRVRAARLNESRHRHNLERRNRARERRRKRNVFYGSYAASDRITVRAPEQIDLYDQDWSIRLRSFLARLREELYTKRNQVLIDFRRTHRVTAAAMLNVVAEVDRARRVLENRYPVTCIPPRSDLVQQVFKQVGLASLLGLRQNVSVSHRMVTFWRYETGIDSGGEVVDALLDQVERELNGETGQGIYVATTEALLNAVHHGSTGRDGVVREDDDGIPILPRRWWLFGGVHDGYLSLVVSDLGIGIPRSLPLRWRDHDIRMIANSLSLQSNDSDYIRVAMELHRTRTGQRNRGRGMRQLRNAITDADAGYLVVYSNRGVYKYHGDDESESRHNFKYGIHGTTIEWSMPLESARDISA